MTIAGCAVTGEGVVLGADSTSTMIMSPDGSQRYLANEQKLFEVGENGTIGVLTWGLGRIGSVSHRTRIADLSDEISKAPPANVFEVATVFANMLWPAYDRELRPQIDLRKAVLADPASPPPEIEKAKAALESFVVGFCVAGRYGKSREPSAYEVTLRPELIDAPVPVVTPAVQFWGANLLIYRLLGFDPTLAKQLFASGKWSGSEAELNAFFARQQMPILSPVPMRETIDAVHALLHMTIKVMKFTSLPPVCGGHIELATITTDRNFRWVRHKTLAAALDHP